MTPGRRGSVLSFPAFPMALDVLRGLKAQEQVLDLPPARHSHEAAESHRGPLPARVAGLELDGEAFAAGLEKGDEILAVNGAPVADVIEFSFLTSGEPARLTVRRGDATLEFELPGLGPTGIHFERELFDGVRRCENNCVFCFVHQLPTQEARQSLKVKDEDYRLSFLHGGYVTLGNHSDEDYEKILSMRLSPMYVSVHSTDRAVRNRMLGNPDAPDVHAGLGRLRDGGIDFYGQIVLVPGYNTGEDLARTLAELAAYPNMLATAVVPVGLTRHRRNLEKVRALTPAEAAEAIDTVDAARRAGRGAAPRLFAADELYQLAGRPVPSARYYGRRYPLREDGVGMLRAFEDGFVRRARRGLPAAVPPARVALVTGTSAAGFFTRVVAPALGAVDGLALEVVPVVNEFFGPGITVAGLLTGRDVIAAVSARGRFDRVLLPEHAFQPGGDLMLDGTTRAELEAALGRGVARVDDEPGALVAAALGLPDRASKRKAA